MRGGARDSFFAERLAMRERGPSAGWYVLPVVAAILPAVAIGVLVLGHTWGMIARRDLAWPAGIAAAVVIVLAVCALFGARRRGRNMLGTSVAVGLAGLAMLALPPTPLTYEHGLLWYKDQTGQEVARAIAGSAREARGHRVQLDTLLNEFYGGAYDKPGGAAAVEVEGFMYRDLSEMEAEFQTPYEQGPSGELASKRPYQQSQGYRLGRFYVWETLGDAALLDVDVSYPDINKKKINFGDWVRAAGVVKPTLYEKRTIPVLWADETAKVRKPPADPYLWSPE
jgi:hypothetical protein